MSMYYNPYENRCQVFIYNYFILYRITRNKIVDNNIVQTYNITG
jgi:hypothetical protein